MDSTNLTLKIKNSSLTSHKPKTVSNRHATCLFACFILVTCPYYLFPQLWVTTRAVYELLGDRSES